MAENTLVCPECGIALTGRDPVAHALSHWNEYLDPSKSSKEALRRQKATQKGGVTLAEYAKLHTEEV